MNRNKFENGAVAVYMALIIAILVISSALIFNTILTRELRSARSVAASERAFAAANSGYEQALFELAKSESQTTEGDGEIEYENSEKATYHFKGQVFTHDNTRFPCVLASGTLRDETRRLFSGPTECDLISS